MFLLDLDSEVRPAVVPVALALPLVGVEAAQLLELWRIMYIKSTKNKQHLMDQMAFRIGLYRTKTKFVVLCDALPESTPPLAHLCAALRSGARPARARTSPPRSPAASEAASVSISFQF